MADRERLQTQELLDEESLAVLAILLAVSLEFGFGFAKTVDWWAGLVAGPAALVSLTTLFRLRTTHVWLVRAAAWVVRTRPARTASPVIRDAGRVLAGEGAAPGSDGARPDAAAVAGERGRPS